MMRVAILILIAASAAAAQPPPVTPSAPTQPAVGGNAAAGQRAFMEYACYYCHGTVGQGSLPAVGVRIARVPRSLESFTAYVRRPSGRMSSYPAAVISDAALADIYAYLRGLPEPPKALPPAFESLRRR